MNKSLLIISFCALLVVMTASVKAAVPILGQLSYYASDPSNHNQATQYIATINPVLTNGVYVYDLGTIKNYQKPARLVLSITDSDGNYDPTTWYNVTSHCSLLHSSCLFQFTGFTIREVSPTHKYYGWNPVICDATHTQDNAGGCYNITINQYNFLYPTPTLVTPIGPSDLSITFTDTNNNTAKLFMKVNVETDNPVLIWLQGFMHK